MNQIFTSFNNLKMFINGWNTEIILYTSYIHTQCKKNLFWNAIWLFIQINSILK